MCLGCYNRAFYSIVPFIKHLALKDDENNNNNTEIIFVYYYYYYYYSRCCLHVLWFWLMLQVLSFFVNWCKLCYKNAILLTNLCLYGMPEYTERQMFDKRDWKVDLVLCGITFNTNIDVTVTGRCFKPILCYIVNDVINMLSYWMQRILVVQCCVCKEILH